MLHERQVRTLFVSDVHLGCRYAQAENFLSFIESIRPQRLFILGDFLDGWKLKAGWHWPETYTRIVQRLLYLAETGTELLYTPGNHDAFLRSPEVRELVRRSGVDVRVQDEFYFNARNGRRYLVLHGDKFDVVEESHQWLSVAVSYVYDFLLSADWWASRIKKRPGRSPYATCAFIKNAVKTAVRFMSNFEGKLYRYARSRGCDGLICGHIHTPGVFGTDDMSYLNIGDWVENCTALVENYDGSMQLESFFPTVPTQYRSGADHAEVRKPQAIPAADARGLRRGRVGIRVARAASGHGIKYAPCVGIPRAAQLDRFAGDDRHERMQFVFDVGRVVDGRRNGLSQ